MGEVVNTWIADWSKVVEGDLRHALLALLP